MQKPENHATHRGVQIIDFGDGIDPVWIADQVADCLDRLAEFEDSDAFMVAFVISDGSDNEDVIA